MRIGVVCPSRPDVSPHGIERSAWCYSRELAKLGCEIHIFYNQRSKDSRENYVEGLYLHGIPTGTISPALRRVLFYKRCAQTIERINSKVRFDLFSLYGPITLPFAPFLKRYGSPIILHTPTASLFEMSMYIHEVMSTFPKSLHMLVHYFETISYETAFLKFADAIVIPTPRNIKEFKHCYPRLNGSKFHVVPYGQDIYDTFYAKVKDDVDEYRGKFSNRKILLFIGANWSRKGLINLLYAFKKVINILPSVLIVVSPPQEPYISLIRRLDLKVGKDVIITGHVNDEELALLYASCDIFVLPSLHEAFSQTVLEAMAFGKPVVVSPIAGYPLVKDGEEGFVINPMNTNSFTESLIRVLSDEELYRTMSKRAFYKAQFYSWRNCAQVLYKTYKIITKQYT
jgi:glycosyltransferase involved in cell wall biosynthesis